MSFSGIRNRIRLKCLPATGFSAISLVLALMLLSAIYSSTPATFAASQIESVGPQKMFVAEARGYVGDTPVQGIEARPAALPGHLAESHPLTETVQSDHGTQPSDPEVEQEPATTMNQPSTGEQEPAAVVIPATAGVAIPEEPSQVVLALVATAGVEAGTGIIIAPEIAPGIASGGNEIGLAVAQLAMTRAGGAYVWGGNGPDDFDCSGLIWWSFAQYGITVPRNAQLQYDASNPVDSLQPGDLLFLLDTGDSHWNGTDRVTHVGIWTGKSILNAFSEKYGVIENSLNDPYWVSHFAGARRLHAVAESTLTGITPVIPPPVVPMQMRIVTAAPTATVTATNTIVPTATPTPTVAIASAAEQPTQTETATVLKVLVDTTPEGASANLQPATSVGQPSGPATTTPPPSGTPAQPATSVPAAPTAPAATMTPASIPTAVPTMTPTAIPTMTPTAVPTKVPAPTNTPVATPTQAQAPAPVPASQHPVIPSTAPGQSGR